MADEENEQGGSRPDYSSLKGAWRGDYLLLAGIFNLIITSSLSTSLDGNNYIRLAFMVALMLLAASRYLIANIRRETGKGWMFYVILLVMGLFFWMILEHNYNWLRAHLGWLL